LVKKAKKSEFHLAFKNEKKPKEFLKMPKITNLVSKKRNWQHRTSVSYHLSLSATV